MSADPFDPKLQAARELQDAEAVEHQDEQLRSTLVMLYRLTDEQIKGIEDFAFEHSLPFTNAAVQSGSVTQRELGEAQEWIRRRASQEGRTIVEEAMHRRSQVREVVLWEGTKLKPGPELILAHDPYHERSEQLRSLRTELMMRSRARRAAGMFVVLSPGRGEGRSRLCAELAIAFAQLGGRTLLVDADLRRPRQHELFGADNHFGLAQAIPDAKALRLHGIEGVSQMVLLTSGAAPGNPLELLSGGNFERMVSDWRRTYEYVIVDTPPVSEFSDALAVATAISHVVVVSRTRHTTFSAMTDLNRRLQTTNAQVIGAVMNEF